MVEYQSPSKPPPAIEVMLAVFSCGNPQLRARRPLSLHSPLPLIIVFSALEGHEVAPSQGTVPFSIYVLTL